MKQAATEPLSSRYRPREVLQFRILGPLEVVGDHGPLHLGGPKQRATLAILLLSVNRVVSVDRLADDLYSGAAPVTAVTQVQRQISELRKALGTESTIDTRPPGYVLRVAPEQVDLRRFERLAEEADRALSQTQARLAADLLREALDLWRGEALADFTYEPFARSAIERLEELRLAALEQRIEADLQLGRHAGVTAELEQLVAEHPLRERFCRQLMLALHRSGRQAEALKVYGEARENLVEEFGLEPSTGLRELERAILAQDPALDATELAAAAPERVVLVLPSAEDRLDRLLAIAEPLAALPGRELMIARLVGNEGELGPAVAALSARRRALAPAARSAAFTTLEPGRDAARLAVAHDVDLVLVDAPVGVDDDRVPDELANLFEGAPADVAVLAGSGRGGGGGILVPFGGDDHDWAALELGAWLSLATQARLKLVGTKAAPERGRRDASRLLADASLAVQRVAGVDSEPLLVEPTELLAAVEGATLVAIGISPRWRREGIGETRRELVRGAAAPTLLVHRGRRPSGLAPREGRTRFSWSIEP
jgi:DNA-binding SARP family transcriptional activator